MKTLPALASALALCAAAPALADTVVVTADRMVDVVAGKYVERPQVVITDGRIVSVGRQGAPAPGNPRVVALPPGMTLLPGLIDMHVHLTGDPTLSGYKSLEYTDSFWEVVGVANAKKTVEAGFTSVRNVGSGFYDDVGLKQGIDHGYVPGPRITPATFALGATGGHCDGSDAFPPSVSQGRFDAAPYKNIGDTPEEYRKLVRTVRNFGAEVIKLCVTGGVLSKTDSAGAQQMTYAEIQAAVDEVHMLGLKVAVHAHGTDGINAALRAGVDTVEHASLANTESFRLAKASGAWFSMDIYDDDYILAEGEKKRRLRREPRQGEGDRQEAARDLPRRPRRGREDDLRRRRRRLSARNQCAPVRQGGGVGHDAGRGDPLSHQRRRHSARKGEGCGPDRARALRRPDRGFGRSAGRCATAGDGRFRDEGRRGREGAGRPLRRDGAVRRPARPAPRRGRAWARTRPRPAGLRYAGSTRRR